MFTIVTLNLDECYIAEVYSDRSFKKLWSETSNVPKHHKAGGQSAKRFQQQRANEIVQWYKEVTRHLPESQYVLAMNKVYSNKFFKYSDKNQVQKQVPLETGGLTGIYETLNRLSS